MSHRAVHHSTTTYSPFYLLYGMEIWIPNRKRFNTREICDKYCASRRDSIQHHLETLVDRLKEVYQVVTEKNRIGRERQEYYNIGTKLVTFQQGDMVYLKEMWTADRNARKFRIRWEGPYEVIRRLSDLNYLVKLLRTKEIVVNVKKMRCFRQTAIRPKTKQRNTRKRVEDKLETLVTYGTI